VSILPTWPIAVGTLVLGLAAGAWIDHTVMAGRIAKIEKGHADVMRQLAEVKATDERENRTKEQKAVERLGQLEQEKIDAKEQARVASAAALNSERMRQRAERRPAPTSGMPEATATCAGATGAELSRPDATFLIGLAQRADEQRAALAACYGAYDSVR